MSDTSECDLDVRVIDWEADLPAPHPFDYGEEVEVELEPQFADPPAGQQDFIEVFDAQAALEDQRARLAFARSRGDYAATSRARQLVWLLQDQIHGTPTTGIPPKERRQLLEDAGFRDGMMMPPPIARSNPPPRRIVARPYPQLHDRRRSRGWCHPG
jgi:hypothetical protein